MLSLGAIQQQLQNWSEKEYSDWMDKHPLEKDRLVFIQ